MIGEEMMRSGWDSSRRKVSDDDHDQPNVFHAGLTTSYLLDAHSLRFWSDRKRTERDRLSEAKPEGTRGGADQCPTHATLGAVR